MLVGVHITIKGVRSGAGATDLTLAGHPGQLTLVFMSPGLKLGELVEAVLNRAPA